MFVTSICIPHWALHSFSRDRSYVHRRGTVFTGLAGDDGSSSRLHHGAEAKPLQGVFCLEVNDVNLPTWATLSVFLVLHIHHLHHMVIKKYHCSLMRLSERGHLQATRRRFTGTMPACSGRKPRPLALGQAAPAFLVLLQLTVLALLILLAELVCHRWVQSDHN